MHDAAYRILVLVNIAAVVEKADEALLPAVYREIGEAFGATPYGLGTLTLIRALVQAFSFPLAAYLSLTYDRVLVIALGALTWGVSTAAVGLSQTFLQVAVSRAINGVGLALVIPAIQSLVADSSSPEHRGMAFGWLQFNANFGSIVGGCAGIMFAGSEDLIGLSGWRVAFLLVAAISVLLALALYGAATPQGPRESRKEHTGDTPHWRALWSDLLAGASQVIRIPTFQVIVAQGMLGSFPWAALAFAAMWLELIGFSHVATALLLGSFSIFTCVGGLFGGWLADFMERRFPMAGRVICAQISSGSAVPLSALLLLGLPHNPDWFLLYLLVFCVMGFAISWNASATNNPIFAEIVAEKHRTNIYALDRMIETAVAAFAPPTVGYLTQHLFHYTPSPPGGSGSSDLDNASALSKGLFLTMALPYFLCCIVYTALYWTYPKDVRHARAISSIEGERLTDPQQELSECAVVSGSRSNGLEEEGRGALDGALGWEKGGEERLYSSESARLTSRLD